MTSKLIIWSPALISIFILELLGLQPLVTGAFLWQWLLMTAGGGLFTPLWFILFSKVDRAFFYQPAVETSFRPDREIERGRH